MVNMDLPGMRIGHLDDDFFPAWIWLFDVILGLILFI